jgi:hypothetical protein
MLDNSQEEDNWFDDDQDESIAGLVAGSFGRSVLLESIMKVSTATSHPSIFKGGSIDNTLGQLSYVLF